METMVKADGSDSLEIVWSPVSRVAGPLVVRCQIDRARRRVEDAFVEAPMFRGMEMILQGRAPEDAVHLASRVCGVCGSAHGLAAAMALEMAGGVAAPPVALLARHLGLGAEIIADQTFHLFALAGPDYAASVVRRTTPELWRQAERADAPHTELHGLRRIADLLRELEPLTGSLYREALQMSRAAREVAALIFGKSPHSSTIFAAGLGLDAGPALFNHVFGRMMRLLDYAKKTVAVWDDVVDFFLAGHEEYAAVGERPVNLLSVGLWDDPEVYDARASHCADWGEKRLMTPGVVLGGRLRTTRLPALNLEIEEFVEHSFYHPWTGTRFRCDPQGVPLSPAHPWNKKTLPAPARRQWEQKYSWCTSPRWNRMAMEGGPVARLWITALAGKVNNEYIRSRAEGVQIEMPRGHLPAQTLTWRVPKRLNTLERQRARAYQIAYAAMAAYVSLIKGFDAVRQGHQALSRPSAIPDEALGVGFAEAGRGPLLHYLEIIEGKIANYQILTSSTWVISPRDSGGTAGPLEEALIHTPLVEECEGNAPLTGIDLLRTIRSFDPCLPCAVH
jgi:hydrogenase large subunit